MQLPTVQIVLSLALVAVVTAEESEKEAKKPKSLQIGIKKRVDPDKCTIKSKKGDTLHMHYTVGIKCSSAYWHYINMISISISKAV